MGMLFDHGCDAFVAVFNAFLLIRMFTLGSDPYQIFLFMIALFPFYFVTMEQYYTGEMNFPPINGVDEGSVFVLIMSFVTAFYGNMELWAQIVTVPFLGWKIPLNYTVKYSVIYVIYGYGLSGLVNIYQCRHKEHFKAIYQRKYFVAQIIFYFVPVITMTMLQVYSQCDIWKTHARTIGLVFGFQIVYVILRFQYSHIIHAQVNPFRRSILLIWLIQWFNLYHLVVNKNAYFDEVASLYVCLAIISFVICY
jgi:hypothetical protein